MEIEQYTCEHPMGQRNKKEKICFETQMEKTTYQNLWDGTKNCSEKKIYKQ